MHPSYSTYLGRGVGLLLMGGLAGCQAAQPSPAQPTPLPQDSFVQVYTNHDPATQYTEPYRGITRSGTNLEQEIIHAMSSAQATVDVAVQELRLPNIAQALIERRRAGVKVRVILENTYSRPFSSFTEAEVQRLPERERSRFAEAQLLMDQNGDGQLSKEEINQRDALVMLRNAKIPWMDDTADGSRGSNLMHHKFVVVDGRTVIVTSANFTPSDVHGDFKSPSSRGNANNLLKIDSSELAQLFTEEFEVMWGDGPGGKPNSRFGVKKPFRPARRVQLGSTSIDVQFSPTGRAVPWKSSSNGLIGKTLGTAQQSIAMALFVFSDQPLVDGLAKQHQTGVQIRTLIDPGFAYRPFSEGLDMLGVVLAEKCKFEPDNRPWKPAIATVGVPRMPPGDLLHHKFGVIDGQTVITGSHNWTAAANNGNDETVLVIRSPLVAAHFEREFERLYKDAILGVPPAIVRRVQEQQKQCPQLVARAPVKKSARSSKPPSTHSVNRSPIPAKTAIRKAVKQKASGNDRPRSAPKKGRSGRSTPQPAFPVNLNTATQAELESLPGVGASLAQRILAARQEKPFRSLADLDQIPGVGPKLLGQLEGKVTW